MWYMYQTSVACSKEDDINVEKYFCSVDFDILEVKDQIMVKWHVLVIFEVKRQMTFKHIIWITRNVYLHTQVYNYM